MENTCGISAEKLKLLRAPFPDNQISKLPKPTKKQTADVTGDYKLGIRCKLCGGWHHKDVVHLDYVGHAALTDRLLDVDPCWNWEPVALSPDGTPSLDGNKGMWIKLTICGHTRLGYGHAEGKNGGDAIKEVIGDALRNAAMRFGAALDLWHKGDLHGHHEDEESETKSALMKAMEEAEKPANDAELRKWWKARVDGLTEMLGTGDTAKVFERVKERLAAFSATNQKTDMETPSENPFEERAA